MDSSRRPTLLASRSSVHELVIRTERTWALDVTLHVDHVIPVARGGSNDPANLISARAECNSGKDKFAQERPASAIPTPRQPSYEFQVLVPKEESDTAKLLVTSTSAGPGQRVDVTTLVFDMPA
jgi:hypothetical protein